MNRQKPHFSADSWILIAALILANLRASVFFPLYPFVAFSPLAPVWIETALWLVVFVAMVRQLARNGLFSAYWRLWRANWVLGAFVLIALLSVVWSVSCPVSLFRWVEFFSATALAVYIGLRYDLRKGLASLAWMGAYVVLFSLLLALFVPSLGTMPGYPYYGAWRGLFWHRNHFGSLMALFNMVYLFQISNHIREDRPQAFFWGFFYLLTMSMVLLSRSATGIILLLSINLAIALVLLWLHFKSRLQPMHYYFFGAAFLIVSLMAVYNIDPLLGLLGRNSTLTGRIDLWTYLIQEVVPQRPILGYGFGYIWNDRLFRLETSQAIHWPFPVLIGDNGFMDILLHLGLVGLIIFLGVIGVATVRALRFAFAVPTLTSFTPLLFVGYALLANSTFSLFAEREVFVWMLFVVVLLMTDPSKQPLQ